MGHAEQQGTRRKAKKWTSTPAQNVIVAESSVWVRRGAVSSCWEDNVFAILHGLVVARWWVGIGSTCDCESRQGSFVQSGTEKEDVEMTSHSAETKRR